MANYAKVTIEFNDVPTLGQTIDIVLSANSISNINIVEKCKHTRVAPGQYEMGITPYASAINLRDAIIADYVPLSSQLLVSLDENINIVTIEWLDYDNASFTNNSTESNVTITITEEIPPDPQFSILSYEAQPPQIESVCSYQRVKLTVENAVYPISINYSGGTKSAANDSELWVEVPRYLPGEITLTDDTDATDSITPAQIICYFIIAVDVNESLSGATITIISGINHLPGNPLNLEYSLNGTDYQSSNVFSGILAGNYTAYLRDSFGCVKTKEFTVEGLETLRPEPSFIIEKANPLRFVNSDSVTIENVENTLFNNQDIPNIEKYYFRQPFQLGTVVRTQIKTSYRDITAKVIDDCTGEILQTITPDLKIQNIAQKDKRDCIFATNSEDGNLMIFFPQGNIYEPGTDTVINTYSSRGQLPSFAQIGMFVSLQLGFGNYNDIQIKDFIYSENYGYWCMTTDVTSILGDDVSSGTCESVYNAEEYDVYEFSFTENKGQFRVEIEATDENSNYSDLLFESEPFVFDDFENIVNIRYLSEDNQSGINYQTGIVFNLDIPGRFFKYSPGGEDEAFEDDYGNRQIQKAVYFSQLELETGMIPAWLAEKIVIASTHEDLTIQGIDVTMADRPEIEAMSENNNPLYVLTGVYQVNNRVIRDERTGIVSSSRAVIGVDGGAVLGV